jgi:hypothetical protein
MGERQFASSVGPVDVWELTFKVSDIFLEEWGYKPPDEWSPTVQFRFEQREDGQWDLVMRRIEP